MKFPGLFLVVFVILVMVGPSAALAQIKVGDEEKDVLSFLGKPLSTRIQGKQRVLEYPSGDVFTENGKVVKFDESVINDRPKEKPPEAVAAPPSGAPGPAPTPVAAKNVQEGPTLSPEEKEYQEARSLPAQANPLIASRVGDNTFTIVSLREALAARTPSANHVPLCEVNISRIGNLDCAEYAIIYSVNMEGGMDLVLSKLTDKLIAGGMSPSNWGGQAQDFTHPQGGFVYGFLGTGTTVPASQILFVNKASQLKIRKIKVQVWGVDIKQSKWVPVSPVLEETFYR
ncbi:MAG: hypothetical protein SFY92_12415 [Verrucomicrobiae bacterium]|nr:hypothetical protein [Verrucomicrobiae bacterium]